MAGAGTGYRQQVLFTTNYEGGRLGDKMEHIEANTISWVERAGKCNHRRGGGSKPMCIGMGIALLSSP